jgi:hypothetical protein
MNTDSLALKLNPPGAQVQPAINHINCCGISNTITKQANQAVNGGDKRFTFLTTPDMIKVASAMSARN